MLTRFFRTSSSHCAYRVDRMAGLTPVRFSTETSSAPRWKGSRRYEVYRRILRPQTSTVTIVH